MKKLIIFLQLLIVGLIFINQNSSLVNAETQVEESTNSWFDASEFREETYYRKHSKWVSKDNYEYVIPTGKISFSVGDSISINPGYSTENVSGIGEIVTIREGDSYTYKVTVAKTGLYNLGLNYTLHEDFYSKPLIDILINGESLFNEMTDLELEVSWNLTEREEDDLYNRYGNELLPYTNPMLIWYKYTFEDSKSSYKTPYYFLLQEGENLIKITSKTDDLTVSDLYVTHTEKYLTYDEYKTANSGKLDESNGQIITLQAEDFIEKNDLEIKSSYYKDPAMTPFEYKNTVLNQLDGYSVNRGGTRVKYTINVEKSGYYNIAFKYLHDQNLGVVSAKKIIIDGEVLFEDFASYQFSTARKYTNHILGDENGYYEIYLESGSHTFELESTTAHLASVIDELNSINDWINSVGLNVKSITGSSNDDMIEWPVTNYIPTLKQDLLDNADKLEAIYDQLANLDRNTNGDSPELSQLKVAAKQLRRIAKQPNKIATKLTEFCDGSGSAYQMIGITISTLMESPLSVDAIYFFDAETVDLPKARSGFFKKAWISVKSFIYSFFDERYKVSSSGNDDVLDVWVGQSSLYLDIIQNMIDDDFTKETGIKVKVNILPSTQKIILSNSTGDNPDVVLSIDCWEPYAYALRGILEDLTDYDGFYDVVKDYYPNNFAPVIYEDGVYAIPETQSSYLLYYRKDILNFLNITPPSTWQEVIDILPLLQSYQMNFFHPLGGDGAYKGYGLISPLIYQHGGEIYNTNGLTSTLTDEATINAIKFMTDLFTIYNLPLQVSNFFEHFRSGSLPIGVSTIDLYLQLKYAAPELAGQWGVVEMPGVYNPESGKVERWAASYGKCSILMSNSNMNEEGWKLIKWWNSAAVQTEYMKNIKMNLGERYMFVPANMTALANSVWDQDIKSVVISQAAWARIPAVTPGSYIVERELSQIWNKVVVDKVNVRIAIDESIPRINRELARKFEEFGYLDKGVVVKEYEVATNKNIYKWLTKEDDNE